MRWICRLTFGILIKIGLPLTIKAITPLAKIVLISLAVRAKESAADEGLLVQKQRP